MNLSHLKVLRNQIVFTLSKLISFLVHFIRLDSTHFGCPIGYHLTLDSYINLDVDNSTSEKITTLPPVEIDKPFNYKNINNRYSHSYRYPETDLVFNNIYNCRFHKEPHALITSDDRLIFSESCAYGMNPKEHWIFRKFKLSKVNELNGNSFSLGITPNLWHLLMEEIPKIYRLGLIDKNINTFDHIIGQSFQLDVQKEIYNLFDVPTHKFKTFDKSPHFKFDNLSFFSSTYTPDFSGIKWMKKTILQKIKINEDIKFNRFFINRKNYKTKNIHNEDEFNRILKKYNFETIEPENLDFSTQVSTFRNASFIIGAHGAGLAANTIFCKKDTKIIEIRSDSHPHDYAAPYVCMWPASINKLEHSVLFCKNIKNKKLKGRMNTDSDFFVNIFKFEELIKFHLNE